MVDEARGCGHAALAGAHTRVRRKSRPAETPYARDIWYLYGATTVHGSHRLGFRGGIIWCWGCGGFTAGVGLLIRPCRRGLDSNAKQRLSRIRRGLTPTSSVTKWPSENADLPKVIHLIEADPWPAMRTAERKMRIPANAHGRLLKRMLTTWGQEKFESFKAARLQQHRDDTGE
jgi:hypothetical protein